MVSVHEWKNIISIDFYLVFCAVSMAYTPPFSRSTYFYGTIDKLTTSRWYVSSMNEKWGDATTQEINLPSTMVDSSGNLYVLTYAGTTKYWDYRLTRVSYNNILSTKCFSLYDGGFCTTKFQKYYKGYIKEYNCRWRHFWPNMLRPVIFQELVRNDKAILCAFLTNGKDECTEVMCFVKFDRYNLTWVNHYRTNWKNNRIWDIWYHQYMWLGCKDNRHNYNEGIYLGYYNGNSDGQFIFCYQKDAVPDKGEHSINSYSSDLSSVHVNHNGENNGISLGNAIINNNSGHCISSLMVEPRIIKYNSDIYYLATEGLKPRIRKWDGSSWYNCVLNDFDYKAYNLKGVNVYGYDANKISKEMTAYHFDFFVTGSNTIAVLGFTTGDKMNWNKNYVGWNADKICLSVMSGIVGSTNFSADPQNVIYVTDVDRNTLEAKNRQIDLRSINARIRWFLMNIMG